MPTVLTGSRRQERPQGLLRQWARRALFSRLERIERGRILIVESGHRTTFGREGDLDVRIDVQDPRFYRAMAASGSVGAGEAYSKGWWFCDDTASLVELLLRNREVLEDLDRGLARIVARLRRAGHALRRHTRAGARKNIAAHYDLGNNLYEIMLDPTMAYSCGVFESDETTLEEASQAKFDRLCRKLDLHPGEHLLEIGTGWGGLALWAAERYGCRVTTTTISRKQASLARRRVREAGLERRIEILETDYRDLEGSYDKLVSIEMIEAVGLDHLDGYFERCASLLRESGVMALQAIVIDEALFGHASRNVDFIQRHIFPGGALPSVTAMARSIAPTDLRITHLEDLTEHYPRTLAEWKRRVDGATPRLRELGYSEEFLRLWDFYLCYCQGGFRAGSIGDVQMVLSKPQAPRSPVTLPPVHRVQTREPGS